MRISVIYLSRGLKAMLHHVSSRSPQYQCGYLRRCGTVALPFQDVGDVHVWLEEHCVHYRGYEGKRRVDGRMRVRRIVKHKVRSIRSNRSLNKIHSDASHRLIRHEDAPCTYWVGLQNNTGSHWCVWNYRQLGCTWWRRCGRRTWAYVLSDSQAHITLLTTISSTTLLLLISLFVRVRLPR